MHILFPDAFDTELLLSCMETLSNGRAVSIPNYDFKRHQKIDHFRMVLTFSFNTYINMKTLLIMFQFPCLSYIVSLSLGFMHTSTCDNNLTVHNLEDKTNQI